jgi:ABC-type transport system substrate-binding protein
MWSGPGEPQPVVAEDVAIHLQRLLEHVANGALPLSQRPWHYASIERVEALSDSMLRIDTSAPDPFLLETLAGPFASVQSPAAIEAFGPLLHERRPEHLIGSGPFLYRGTDELGALLFERRDGSPALLDGLVVAPAGGTLAGFQELLLDEFIARDRRDAAAIREGAGRSLVEETIFEDSPIVSSFSVGAPPWDNPGLRQAISGALNRAWLVEALFGGRAVPSAHIARSSARPFLAPAAELARFPGFETDAQAGASEARARWDAAGGGSVGALTVDFPAVFDPLYGASAIVTARLSEVLGVEVRPAVDSYTNIAGKLAAGGYGNGDPAFWFGWDAAVVSPEPSRTLIERFLSNSATAATHGFADEGIDRLLSSLGGAFDMEQRAALAMEVEASLLENAGGGIIPWVLQQSEHFRRAYLAGAPRTPFGDQHLDASRWLDRQGPGFGDRPA